MQNKIGLSSHEIQPLKPILRQSHPTPWLLPTSTFCYACVVESMIQTDALHSERCQLCSPYVLGPQIGIALNQSQTLPPLFSYVNRRTKLTIIAIRITRVRSVGPSLSSKPACPLNLIDLALQWKVPSAYIIVSIAASVKRNAEMKAGLSPKFSMPIASAPITTPKLSHDRKVRSFAKKTLGSTRVGKAIRLPWMIVMLA